VSPPDVLRWHVELAQLERDYFGRLVESCSGSQAEIARIAGLPRQSVRNILDRNGLRARCAELRASNRKAPVVVASTESL
jgi:hypothetical protein